MDEEHTGSIIFYILPVAVSSDFRRGQVCSDAGSIEDKVHQMAGKVLRDPGWTYVILHAQVGTSDLSQFLINIKSSTHDFHQVSLMSIHLLKGDAFTEHCCSKVLGPPA